MRDLLLLAVYGCFLVLGAAAPFVLALGYVWVDAFRPQEVSYGLLTSLPVSMMMGAAAVGGWFLMDRRQPAPPGPIVVLLLFGAPTIPELAKALGQSMRILKKEVRSDADGAANDAADAEPTPAAPVAQPTAAEEELARAKAEAAAAKAEAEALRAAAEKRES